MGRKKWDRYVHRSGTAQPHEAHEPALGRVAAQAAPPEDEIEAEAGSGDERHEQHQDQRGGVVYGLDDGDLPGDAQRRQLGYGAGSWGLSAAWHGCWYCYCWCVCSWSCWCSCEPVGRSVGRPVALCAGVGGDGHASGRNIRKSCGGQGLGGFVAAQSRVAPGEQRLSEGWASQWAK